MTSVQEFSNRLIANIEQVIVGKRPTVDLAVISLLCQGHLLIEDVPGVGKTMLARSLARSLGISFSRIQFTPDMLPRHPRLRQLYWKQWRNGRSPSMG
jgi:MoxR-like ATPase